MSQILVAYFSASGVTKHAAEEVTKMAGANVIKLRIDSYQGIQTKCMPFLFSLDKSPKM